jgi:DNA-binding CsgD family transcriptional regulator
MHSQRTSKRLPRTERHKKIDPIKIWRLAKLHALSTKQKDLALDFAGYAVLQVMDGRYDNLKWIFSDYFRALYGDQRIKSGRLKNHAHRFYEDLNTFEVQEVSDFDRKWEQLISPLELTATERYCFLLYYSYGMRMPEIAEFLGVTLSRISQHIRSVYAKLKACNEIDWSLLVAVNPIVVRNEKDEES